MFYRENGQFKTSYAADQQIFAVTQDRIAIWLLLAVAFLVVPFVASNYVFQAILIPLLIMSLGALGLNILVGYCGQISLGTAAFMAVGAYAAYNLQARFEGMPLLLALSTASPFWMGHATGLMGYRQTAYQEIPRTDCRRCSATRPNTTTTCSA